MGLCPTCGKPNPDPIYARYRALEQIVKTLEAKVKVAEILLSIVVRSPETRST